MLYLRHLSQCFCIVYRENIHISVIFHLYETVHQVLVSKEIETKKHAAVDKFLLPWQKPLLSLCFIISINWAAI